MVTYYFRLVILSILCSSAYNVCMEQSDSQESSRPTLERKLSSKNCKILRRMNTEEELREALQIPPKNDDDKELQYLLTVKFMVQTGQELNKAES